MALTKRTYVAVADLLATQIAPILRPVDPTPDPLLPATVWAALIEAFGDYFAADNPAFDRARFMGYVTTQAIAACQARQQG